MTVLTDTRITSSVGDGVTVTFPYAYLVYDEAHLEILYDGVVQPGVLQSSTGVGNPAGGNVTVVSAPALGVAVDVQRRVPATQLLDYSAYDDFPEELHEKGLDLTVMLAQQVEDESGEANTASNVGGGQGLFKQKNSTDLEFFSFVSGDASVSLTPLGNGTEIDIRATGAGGGEANTGSNLGAGAEVFKQKVGIDLEHRTLVSGDASVSFTEGATEIDIRATGAGGGEANNGVNVGTGVGVFKDKSGVNLRFKSILGETGKLVATANADDITLTLGTVVALLNAAQEFTQNQKFGKRVLGQAVAYTPTAGNVALNWDNGNQGYVDAGEDITITSLSNPGPNVDDWAVFDLLVRMSGAVRTVTFDAGINVRWIDGNVPDTTGLAAGDYLLVSLSHNGRQTGEYIGSWFRAL